MLNNSIYDDLPKQARRRVPREAQDLPGSLRPARMPSSGDAALPALPPAHLRILRAQRAGQHVARVAAAGQVRRAASLNLSVSEAAARLRWPDLTAGRVTCAWLVADAEGERVELAATGAHLLPPNTDHTPHEVQFLGCVVLRRGLLFTTAGMDRLADLMDADIDFVLPDMVELPALRRMARAAAYTEVDV